MRILTFANQKGGVAKTTSAVNVAVGLAQRGHRVLLCDMDPQANTTYSVLGATEPERTAYDLLIRDQPLRTVVTATPTAGLTLLPSGIDLAGAASASRLCKSGQTLGNHMFNLSENLSLHKQLLVITSRSYIKWLRQQLNKAQAIRSIHLPWGKRVQSCQVCAQQ